MLGNVRNDSSLMAEPDKPKGQAFTRWFLGVMVVVALALAASAIIANLTIWQRNDAIEDAAPPAP